LEIGIEMEKGVKYSCMYKAWMGLFEWRNANFHNMQIPPNIFPKFLADGQHTFLT
jgi:hypothetical protein